MTGSAISGGNPELAALGNYGGPTQTMPPLPLSPAIGAGSTALIPHAAGVSTVSGSLEAVRCRPPSVEAIIAAGLGAPPAQPILEERGS